MSKQMLILTGPQGAGNHLWSKVFSKHPDVYGWKSLLENYWEPHRFNEPFASFWRDPSKLKDFAWVDYDYYFTSISVPLGIPGHNSNPLWEPNLLEFKQAVEAQGIETKFAVIGRDQTILREQQTRIRTEPTLPLLLKQLPEDAVFLSYELLYLYKDAYIKSLDIQTFLKIVLPNMLVLAPQVTGKIFLNRRKKCKLLTQKILLLSLMGKSMRLKNSIIMLNIISTRCRI